MQNWIKTDNVNANSSNIIFTMKDTKLYAPVATLSARDFKTSSRDIETS